MKKYLFKLFIFTIFLAVTSFVYFVGCSNIVTPSLYSTVPTGPTGSTPEITSVDPPNVALAGVTNITITGNNFLSDTSAIKVYFGKQAGTILTASPTKITVISPNIAGSVKIKISTNVAEPYSNTYDYLLNAASKDWYPDVKDHTNIPMSIIIDNAGNIYSSNYAMGVVQITPDSVSTLYSAKGGETYWTTMRLGTGGVLYAARGNQAVFTIPAGGGKNSAWVVLSPSTLKISQIEFDPLGNMWAAGKNSAIYKIKPDKSYSSYPFNFNVTAMRVFVNGSTTYLYAAVQQDSMTTIMRMPIDSNGNLGTQETYFDFSSEYGRGFTINDITFAADGEMFLATNLPSPIVYVNNDKSTGVLYPSILLKSPALSLAWGTGNYLYYVRRQINDATGAFVLPQTIVKLDLQKPGAPYYGK
ncbi:MAG: IPT/TIG domain-containing protein [Bacteroidetes bacterium]|nr:IPT/TIG domain-containing protein [Bacteroidota bacterium]